MTTRASRSSTGSQAAMGLALFAGILMVIGGVFHALAGISALFNDRVYVTTPQYIYAFDITAWGWIHLVLGALVAFAGIGVIQGQTWGRIVGVLLVGLSLIANFLFLPYYPLWSILIIALDIAVIWGLTTYREA